MKYPLLLLFTALTLPASAGTTAAGKSSAMEAAPAGSPFDAGRWEIQSITGAYFSLSSDSIEDTELNGSLSTYRIGLMLDSASGTGWCRGNSEILAEGFFGSVFEGPGDFFGGASVLLRYNFVQQECRWVPYLQGGAGAFYSDIQKNHLQNLIGSAWEINLQAAVGVRYFLNEKWTLDLEGGYRRVTHTGSSDRNDGLDALGAQIGLSRFF